METHVLTNAGVLIGTARRAVQMWCSWNSLEYVLHCMYFVSLEEMKTGILYLSTPGKLMGNEVDQSPKSFFVIELNEHFVSKSACDRGSFPGC